MRIAQFAYCLALSATPALAQRIAEQEPNNGPAQAQTLAANTQVAANLAAGDQDWFTFTLAAASEIHLRTTGNFGVNPSVDTGVFLFDATGTTRLAWNDNASGTLSDVGCNLPAGTYLVQVLGKLATTSGDYGLDFVTLPAAVIQTVEGPEPNHDPASGGVPTPITIGDTVAGDLASPTDVDWYTFAVTTRSLVQAIVYDDGGVPQLDNTQVQFFQELAPGVFGPFSPVGSSTNSTSHRAFTLSHPTTLAPGNYAIQVAAGTAAVGTAPFIYTKTGKYALRTRLVAMPGFNTVPEGPEPNNAAGSANVPFFVPGEQLTGFCSGGNEEDWWAFAVGGPTTIVAMCESASTATPMTNQDLKIYDANGTSLATATSGGPGSHGRLVYTVSQAGIYYLAAYGGSFALSGDYVVHTGMCEPLYVASSWSATPPSTNACPGSNALRPALGVASTEAPQLGSTFVVRLSNTLPFAVAVPFFGFSRTLANGSVPLPFDLSPNEPNAFNKCMVRVDPLITTLLLTDAAGIGYIDYALPPDLALRGLPMFVQSMQLDAAMPNAYGVSVSNDARLMVGDRSY